MYRIYVQHASQGLHCALIISGVCCSLLGGDSHMHCSILIALCNDFVWLVTCAVNACFHSYLRSVSQNGQDKAGHQQCSLDGAENRDVSHIYFTQLILLSLLQRLLWKSKTYSDAMYHWNTGKMTFKLILKMSHNRDFFTFFEPVNTSSLLLAIFSFKSNVFWNHHLGIRQID